MYTIAIEQIALLTDDEVRNIELSNIFAEPKDQNWERAFFDRITRIDACRSLIDRLSNTSYTLDDRNLSSEEVDKNEHVIAYRKLASDIERIYVFNIIMNVDFSQVNVYGPHFRTIFALLGADYRKAHSETLSKFHSLNRTIRMTSSRVR